MEPPRMRTLEDRMRQDIFFHLRWNTLGPLEDIEIAAGPHGQEKFIPFFGSSYENESIAHPPLSRVEVSIAELWGKRSRDFAPEEYRYQPPPGLIINNHDDSPITVGQFVTEVQSYLTKHMDEIKKAKSEIYGKLVERDGTVVRDITYERPYLPPDIKIFFRRIWASGNGDVVVISVVLYAEGDPGRSVDEFWAIQLQYARMAEQKRQGYQATTAQQ